MNKKVKLLKRKLEDRERLIEVYEAENESLKRVNGDLLIKNTEYANTIRGLRALNSALETKLKYRSEQNVLQF